LVNRFLNRIKNINLIAFTIGIVYLWFGILKFFPNVSPAEELAKNTLDVLTFGLIPSNISFFILAIWETLIGVLLIANVYNRAVIMFALIHMIFTFTPLFFFPKIAFNDVPFSLTLVGQYIAKNIIIVGALVILLKEYKRKLKTI
jgi:uncharacterized membrane protein YkgB